MKEQITRTTLGDGRKGETDFEKLLAMPDSEIDFSDIPELDSSFWENANLSYPPHEDRSAIRLDHDLTVWLSQDGAGFQTRINSILRSHIDSQLREESTEFGPDLRCRIAPMALERIINANTM
jgi:uncharacterized protein (DUF4415 family)